MAHSLPPLPFSADAVAPVLSAETLEYHHGKHHQAYVTNLNKLVEGGEFASMSLEDIVRKSSGGIFNNAAQHYNHSLYWHCLGGRGGGPSGSLARAIQSTFGSFDQFREQFSQKAVTLFGSGWCWLTKNPDGSLSIEQTSNAGCPLRDGKSPLLTCDVWEHAYYIDYRNARPKYVESFWNIVNWKFVQKCYDSGEPWKLG